MQVGQVVRLTVDDSPLPTRRRRVILPTPATIACLLVSVVGLLVFANGFFPVKPLLSGYASPVTVPPNSGDAGDVFSAKQPPFDRLVFMLVDALRSDFAFGPKSRMSFVASLIESGQGIPFTAIAQSPTVTLPRLKALTTGSNPTFLDAMLNIAEDSDSVLENVDSWVRQLAIGDSETSKIAPIRRLVFAGDDTWLRLFPASWFAWTEGVSSFFVTDTVMVDRNVTRHLDRFLSPTPAPSDEWDALILHYLGMDHVGHLGGPEIHLMGPKQQEMDDVIERLFRHVKSKDEIDGRRSLLVVVGDHGMSETGNHGGSSERETSSALLLASPSMPPPKQLPKMLNKEDSPYRLHDVVSQIDLVPTLSALMGLGIPTNSMGRLIISVMDRFSSSHDLGYQAHLLANSQQLAAVLEAASPGANREILCGGSFEGSVACNEGVKALTKPAQLAKFLHLAQDQLLRTFGDSKLSPMLAGLALLLLSAAGSVLLALKHLKGHSISQVTSLSSMLLFYLVGFFATSFIEEEHEIWFFGTATILLALALRPGLSKRARFEFILAAASVRVMRGWSHNGQKEFVDTSITSLLASDRSMVVKLAVATACYLGVNSFIQLCYACRPTDERKYSLSGLLLKSLTLSVMFVLVLAQLFVLVEPFGSSQFKLSSRFRARTSYGAGAASLFAIKILRELEPTMASYLEEVKLATISCLLLSLTRPSNYFLFFIMWRQYDLLKRRHLPPLLLSSFVIAFQHVSFYALGGSSSLASVDLSQAYNGISSYDVRTVALLTYLSNFSGPVFWSFATNSLLKSRTKAESGTRTHEAHIAFTSAFHSLTIFALAASATHFRTHLFTWTVFSPALLYKGVWSIVVHLGTNLVLVNLLEAL